MDSGLAAEFIIGRRSRADPLAAPRNDGEDSMTIRDTAVIGLGNMGRGIARNLDRAGRLAAAWDIAEATRTRAELSVAVKLAPPDQIAGLKFILFVVPGSAEIDAMLGTLLKQPHDKQILIDLTTSHPAKTKALAEKVSASGRAYVDCGMSGGAIGADSGKMALMVGGTSEAVAACKPIFDVTAGTVTHVGASGTGHAIKLLHNMVCHTNFLVVAEAGKLAERAGIPLETAIKVFNDRGPSREGDRAGIGRAGFHAAVRGVRATRQFNRKLTGTVKLIARPDGGGGNGDERRTIACTS